MTSAAADVIKHNGHKIGRFKPRRFCEVNMHILDWIFVWIQFLTLFKLYIKDKCWCFVYNEIEPFENRHGWRRLKLVMTSAPQLSRHQCPQCVQASEDNSTWNPENISWYGNMETNNAHLKQQKTLFQRHSCQHREARVSHIDNTLFTG